MGDGEASLEVKSGVLSGGSRGSTAGGVTKSAALCAAGGDCGRGIPLPAGGVPGGIPREIFRKMDANGAF